MKSIVFTFLCLFVSTVYASGSFDACANLDVDQYWQDVLEKHPNNDLLLKLSSFRSHLCEMMETESMDSNTASFMWQQALTAALNECTLEQQKQSNFIRLFGTF